MVAIVDTRALPGPSRSTRWQEATARFLVPLDIDSGGVPVTGRIAGVRRERVSFCRLEASPHLGVRTRELADGAGADHVKVAIALGGTVQVRQHGRQATLAPGQWAVYDTGEEYSVGGAVPFGLLVALMPLEVLGVDRATVASVAATAIDATPASAALLATAAGRQGVASVLSELGDVIRCTRPARAHDRSSTELVAAAIAIIRGRLHDPDLGPAYLAAVLGVSRRHLYDVFGAMLGPIAQFIRAERLAQAHRLLTDVGRADVPIAAIGLECGFTDAAHFSRAYRSRFGHPPTRDRLRALDRAP